MTTAITRGSDLDGEKVALLKRTICPALDDDELELFAGQCRRTGLDPFSRQIHATKRWNRAAGREVLTIQVGIDGFRLVAARTGDLDGQDGPQWCGLDGVWRDVWLSDLPPAAARVMVFRRGSSRPYTGVATYREYCQHTKEGKPAGLWGSMPANQLAKCAEALALRKAFPQDLSGLYAPEEMQQAENPEPESDSAPTVKPAPPQPKELQAAPTKPTEPETFIPGDPVTDVESLITLLIRKGADWVHYIESVNRKFGLHLSPTRTKYVAIPREIRVKTVEVLTSQPDARPPDTVDDLDTLFAELSRLDGIEVCASMNRLFNAAGWNVASLDDLNPDQIRRACGALRGKIADVRKSKVESGPSHLPKPAAPNA